MYIYGLTTLNEQNSKGGGYSLEKDSSAQGLMMV